jgi:hypothetical protein
MSAGRKPDNRRLYILSSARVLAPLCSVMKSDRMGDLASAAALYTPAKLHLHSTLHERQSTVGKISLLTISHHR